MKNGRILELLLLMMLLGASGAATARGPEVVFGGDPDYPPFEWLENGQPAGFHVELGQAMADATDASARHLLQPWPDTVDALKSGRVDIVPMFRSHERERHFWFSQPIYFAHHAIYTVSDPGKARWIEDLRNWPIALEASSFAHDQFRSSGHASGLVLVGTTREALEALVEGRAAYAVLATGPADHLSRQIGNRVHRVGTPLWPREYSFAVRRDRIEVAAWVEKSLAAVIAAGTFQQLDAKWREEQNDLASAGSGRFARWLILASLLIVGALAAAAFFYCRGRSSVRAERAKRTQAEESMAFANRHDRVTGLLNLESFAESISGLTSKATLASPLELLVLRVSNLEEIARADGRDAADRLLRAVADHFTGCSISAASLGRGLFGVAVQVSESHMFAARLEETVELRPGSTKPQFMWGAARCPEHGSEVDELIHKAQLALNASASRRRQWLVYEAALEPDPDDLQLIKDFERFGKDQIFAVYQPQLDLSSGRILSAEVLARWRHPDRGEIAPMKFVPLLEMAGLVSHVTIKMIDAAVRQGVRFRACGLACRFSVNLSVQDLRESDVPALVADALERHGGRPEDLLLELTESVAVEDPGRDRGALQRLRTMGVATAIDDFGTGFSSLESLVDLPFSELKIDQVFVRKMLASATHRRIVRSIIEMGHEMAMSVVAEGAEDQDTISALEQKGCDRIQGYAVSRPLPATDLLRFCIEHCRRDPQRRAATG